jgi:hypothetical protein
VLATSRRAARTPVPSGLHWRVDVATIGQRAQADGRLSFVLSAWPRTDDLGRVRHVRDRFVVAVPAPDWQAMLAERRVPEVLRDRPPRIGDAFAVMLERRDARHLLDPIGPVVDVTADARDAARAAFYSAVASPLDVSVAADVAEPEEDRTGSVHEPDEWRAHVSPARSGGRPTTSSASTTPARRTTPASHWARSGWSCRRRATGRSGASATSRATRSTSPPRGAGRPNDGSGHGEDRGGDIQRRLTLGGMTWPQPDVTVVVLRGLESLTSAKSVKRSTRSYVCPRMSAGRILRCPARQSLTLAAA